MMANSLDPTSDKIEVTYIDVLGVNVTEPFKDVEVTINTRDMPEKATIIVEA